MSEARPSCFKTNRKLLVIIIMWTVDSWACGCEWSSAGGCAGATPVIALHQSITKGNKLMCTNKPHGVFDKITVRQQQLNVIFRL